MSLAIVLMAAGVFEAVATAVTGDLSLSVGVVGFPLAAAILVAHGRRRPRI